MPSFPKTERPRCSKCQTPGPTIDGRCSRHLTLPTLAYLYTVSPEDLDLPERP